MVCRPVEVKQVSSESSIEINMIAGTSRGGMFKIGIQRRTNDITVPIMHGGEFGKKKRIMESATMSRIIDQIGFIGQKIINS